MSITKKQIQLIHIAKQQLSIDDDTYKELLANYNVTSSKDLTQFQAEHLLRHLRSKGFKIVKPARNKAKMHNKVIKLTYDRLEIVHFKNVFIWVTPPDCFYGIKHSESIMGIKIC